MRRDDINRNRAGRPSGKIGTSGLACAIAIALTAAGGCDPDIFDVEVDLAPEVFPIDFGSSTGTIPTIMCSPADASSCGTLQSGSTPITLTNGSGDVEVALGCDSSTTKCYAQANARIAYSVDVLQDQSFTSQVGRRAVNLVRKLDIAYTIPTNTATFDIPQINVYAGPPGTAQVTDPGVYPIDAIPPLAAGTTFTAQPMHLTIADGSPARDLIASSIESETPFVFLVTAAPRLESGTAIPAGMLEIDIQPLLGLGLR